MGRLGRLGLEPAERYERAVAGELIHIDVKKLGRIHGGAGKRFTGHKRNPHQTRVDRDGVKRLVTGWEYVHIAIDDATRLAYAEVLEDEKAITAIGFLRRALAFFKAPRDASSRTADRQRPRLPLGRARNRLPDSRYPPSTHQATQATDQRQGRALHPHDAGRLGLRRDLRQQQRTHRGP
jgi:hypothetical protein